MYQSLDAMVQSHVPFQASPVFDAFYSGPSEVRNGTGTQSRSSRWRAISTTLFLEHAINFLARTPKYFLPQNCFRSPRFCRTSGSFHPSWVRARRGRLELLEAQAMAVWVAKSMLRPFLPGPSMAACRCSAVLRGVWEGGGEGWREEARMWRGWWEVKGTCLQKQRRWSWRVQTAGYPLLGRRPLCLW